MTKRDYGLIARIMHQAVIDQEARNNIALTACMHLKMDNPNFKPAMFIKACGADEKVLLALN